MRVTSSSTPGIGQALKHTPSAKPLLRKNKHMKHTLKVNASWRENKESNDYKLSIDRRKFMLSNDTKVSRISSRSLKKLLWNDITGKARSSAIRSHHSKMKIDGMNKELPREKDPRNLDSGRLHRIEGKQRGLVLEAGNASMHLLGKLKNTVEESTRLLHDQTRSQELASKILHNAGTLTTLQEDGHSDLFGLSNLDDLSSLKDNQLKHSKNPPAPSLRRRHVRNNSRSAPSLIVADIFADLGD